MLEIVYAPDFIRSWKKLERELQDEVVERIELFRDPTNHSRLKVHKLSGRMKGSHAFSVNFRYRIRFEYSKDKKEVYLLTVGDHGIYE